MTASGCSFSAEAASWSESGWPRTKRFTLSACSASRPACSSTVAASAGASGPSGIDAQVLAERRAPHRAGRVAGREHDARGLRQRGQVRVAEPVVEQAQPLVGVDHEQLAGSASPTAAVNPAGVGSMARASTNVTSSCSAANARSSADLPAPATPWTTATSGPPSSCSVRSAASSGVAADQRAAREQRAEVHAAANAMHRPDLVGGQHHRVEVLPPGARREVAS